MKITKTNEVLLKDLTSSSWYLNNQTLNNIKVVYNNPRYFKVIYKNSIIITNSPIPNKYRVTFCKKRFNNYSYHYYNKNYSQTDNYNFAYPYKLERGYDTIVIPTESNDPNISPKTLNLKPFFTYKDFTHLENLFHYIDNLDNILSTWLSLYYENLIKREQKRKIDKDILKTIITLHTRASEDEYNNEYLAKRPGVTFSLLNVTNSFYNQNFAAYFSSELTLKYNYPIIEEIKLIFSDIIQKYGNNQEMMESISKETIEYFHKIKDIIKKKETN